MANQPNIDWCECESSNVARHGYDPETKTLAIEYKGGGVYHYPDVDEKVYADMQEAKSVGKFVAQNIRSLNFNKIEKEKE